MKVKYLKTITAPKIIAGKKGVVKKLLPQHAQQLINRGAAELVIESKVDESEESTSGPKAKNRTSKNPVSRGNPKGKRSKNKNSSSS